MTKRGPRCPRFAPPPHDVAPSAAAIDALEQRCLAEFDQLDAARALRRLPATRPYPQRGAIARRATQRRPLTALYDQSRAIARHLLVWEARWRCWMRGERGWSAPLPWALPRESDRVAKLVKQVEEKEAREITNYDQRLRVATGVQRAKVKKAEEMVRRAKKRPRGTLVTLAKASWRLRIERTAHAALVREFNQRRTSAIKVSGKRPLPRKYLLAPLVSWLFACGVPDRGIARLLGLVELPRPLTPRQIKQIRARA